MRKLARGAKRNPPMVVRAFGSTEGHRMSRRVLSIEYVHEHSAQRTPFRHDFDSEGVELWANKDGSITIRHPKLRLWDDYIVEDGE